MSGFEWLFVVLSASLMVSSFWVRFREDRVMAEVRVRRIRRHGRA